MMKLNPDDLMVSTFTPMPEAAVVGAPGTDTGGTDTGGGETGRYTCVTYPEVCDYTRVPDVCVESMRLCLTARDCEMTV